MKDKKLSKQELQELKSKYIMKLAEGDKMAKKALEYMSNDPRIIKMAVDITLPTLRDKGIQGEFLGVLWKVCEEDFIVFNGLIAIIPQDICVLASFSYELGGGIPDSIVEHFSEIVNGIKQTKDEFMERKRREA